MIKQFVMPSALCFDVQQMMVSIGKFADGAGLEGFVLFMLELKVCYEIFLYLFYRGPSICKAVILKCHYTL